MKKFLSISLLIISISLCYYPYSGLYFTAADTFTLIEDSQIDNFQDFQEIWTHSLMHKGKFFRPLASLTYSLDYFLWKLNPRGYFWHNIMWHIMLSLALAALIWQQTRKLWVVFFFVLLWGLHPVGLEVVPAISRRHDIMAVFFGVISCIFWQKSLDEPNRNPQCQWIAMLSLGASLLSKEIGIIFVGILLYQSFRKKDWKWLGVIGLLGMIYLLYRFWVVDAGAHRPLTISMSRGKIMGAYIYGLFDFSLGPIQNIDFIKGLVLMGYGWGQWVLVQKYTKNLWIQKIYRVQAFLLSVLWILFSFILDPNHLYERRWVWHFIGIFFILFQIVLIYFISIYQKEEKNDFFLIPGWVWIWLLVPISLYLYTGKFEIRYLYVSMVGFIFGLSLVANQCMVHYHRIQSKLCMNLILLFVIFNIWISPIWGVHQDWIQSAKFNQQFFQQIQPLLEKIPSRSRIQIKNFPVKNLIHNVDQFRIRSAIAVNNGSIHSWTHLVYPNKNFLFQMIHQKEVYQYPSTFRLNLAQESPQNWIMSLEY